MSTSRKKVIVRKFSRDWLAGYLPLAGFASLGQLEMLDLGGKVTSLQLTDVKWVCFVREFNSGDAANPERLLRRNFNSRPRSEGLWIRLKLKDNDTLEGLAANDVGLIAEEGIFLTPPDIRSNTQRIFVPNTAIAEFEILAVITGAKRKAAADLQDDLFSQNSPSTPL